MLCPKCLKEMQCGYGLAGGGMGVYFFCETIGCEQFEKFQDPEMENPKDEHHGSLPDVR